VDLSLSFFIPVFFLPPYKLRVIAEEQWKERKTANRYRPGIAYRRIFTEFSLRPTDMM
jgi:hypothetical protein